APSVVRRRLCYAFLVDALGLHSFPTRRSSDLGPQEGDLFWIQGLPNQSAMFGFPPAEVFTPDRWLQDNDTVTVGEVTLQVIHTPGHTPGHVVFYSANDKLAIVGDVLFQGSIGRTDFPQGNHEQLVHSIRAKLFPLGDDITF